MSMEPATGSVRMATQGRILIADDEPALRRAYGRILRQAGFITSEASNGHDAIAAAHDKELDVIVSDIGMPGMDGVELLRQIRAANLDLPVLLITGQPTLDTAIRAVEYGALRYLVKPVDEEALVADVASAVRLHQLARLKRQALSLQGNVDILPGDRVALEASVDRALASLWMAYQPIVSWNEKVPYAYEALLRTAEPTFPRPDSLLKAAERLGRIHEIGRATRAQVSASVHESPSHFVFVNLHTHDLLDAALYDSDSPLSAVAERVVLEVTERASLDEVPDIRQRVSRLRSLGFRIAIDDLGAGYAGLTSFAHLEPDVVKLDMSLVRDVHQHEMKRKIVHSMIRLCQEMNLLVVAEGVETVEERNCLVDCGCDLLQGYLFAKPAAPFPKVAWAA